MARDRHRTCGLRRALPLLAGALLASGCAPAVIGSAAEEVIARAPDLVLAFSFLPQPTRIALETVLARVLAGTPRWILADEPLAALDLAHQLSLIAHLKACARPASGAGQGVVVVLHDLAHAMNHADRVLVLGSGALVADGPPETALAPDVIAKVWGVKARWLGEAGARALQVGD